MMRSRLGFQAFGSAWVTLPGIELMPRLKKGQWVATDATCPAVAAQCSSLAASWRLRIAGLWLSTSHLTPP